MKPRRPPHLEFEKAKDPLRERTELHAWIVDGDRRIEITSEWYVDEYVREDAYKQLRKYKLRKLMGRHE